MTETGEKYMKSALNDQWYKVTKWENVEGKPGRHIAKEKEPVEPEEIPEDLRERMRRQEERRSEVVE